MTKKDDQSEQKTERFNMFMSPSEMEAIDEWAWKNRIRSKSEAVRRLVQIGLSADEAAPHLIRAAEGIDQAITQRVEKIREKIRHDDREKTFLEWRDMVTDNTLIIVDVLKYLHSMNINVFQIANVSEALKNEPELSVEELLQDAEEIEAMVKELRARDNGEWDSDE